jgi:hypothetical protein
MIIVGYRYIYKYTKDWQLDSRFKNNSNLANNWIRDIEKQGNKFIISGYFSSIGDVQKNDVARLNPDGSLDNTFDVGSGTGNTVNTVTVQSDNKILVNAYVNSFNEQWIGGMVRLNANGAVDDSFETSDFDFVSTSIRNNKIYVQNNNHAFRLNMDGSVDESYPYLGFEGAGEIGLTFSTLKSGQLIVGNSSEGVPLKYTAKGGPDKFNAPLADQGSINLITKVGKKLYVAGDFNQLNDVSTFGFGVLDQKGNVDPNHHSPFGFVGATQMQGWTDDYAIMKTNCCGMVILGVTNSNFGDILHYNTTSPINTTVQEFKILPDGKMLMATQNGIARFIFNGESLWDRDYSFSGAEIGSNSSAVDFDVDNNDGSIVFGSRFYYYNGDTGGLVRLNSNGTVKEHYTNGYGPNGSITDIVTLPGSEVVVFGDFNFWDDDREVDGSTYIPKNMLKLKADGKIDLKFQETFNNTPVYYIQSAQSFRNKTLVVGYDYTVNYYTAKSIDVDGKITSNFFPSNLTMYNVASLYAPDNASLYVIGNNAIKGQTGTSSIVRITYPNNIPVKTPPAEPDILRTSTHLAVYPNPTSDFISLETDSPANIRILTMDGQTKINANVKGSSDQIDVRSLKPGRYVVKIVANGKVTTEHFVVK